MPLLSRALLSKKKVEFLKLEVLKEGSYPNFEFAAQKREKTNTTLNDEMDSWLKRSLKVHKFAGISLSGGKANKTSLAIIEYFPHQNKIFLSGLIEKIKGNEDESADLVLHRHIEKLSKKLEYVAFDVPLQVPKCLRCKLKCPGYEKCKEPEIKWLRKNYKERNLKKNPKRIFTPYTERCAENFVSTQLEEELHPPHSMGANAAPLTARALFISRRLKANCIEVFPKLSLWRIGRSLNIQKSHLRFHKHAVDGEETRQSILKNLIEKKVAFLYEEDIKSMILNSHSFDAFICAMTALLKFKGQVEKRPRGYPKDEAWIEIPSDELSWD